MSQRYETWSSIHLIEGRECIHNNKVMTYILCFADLTNLCRFSGFSFISQEL